jgi:hypothetical protein
MNYTETRQRLIKVNPDLEAKLPQEWKWRIDLRGAYLYGANLRGADLRGADLRVADLYKADLRGADLHGADLHGADLYKADLYKADLYGADLHGADLHGADLENIKISWISHDLISEVLRRGAGNDIEKLKIAGLILIQRGWCWEQFLALDDPLKEWALDELAKWVQDGDNAPEMLREWREVRG